MVVLNFKDKNGSSVGAINVYDKCKYIDDIYEKLGKIGQGTYGKVFLAKGWKTGDLVAAKKVILKLENDKRGEGVPITAIREIKLLLQLNHPNIIRLKDVVRSRPRRSNNMLGSIYMIFEYMDYDLDGLLFQLAEQKVPLSESQIKCLVHQLFQGLCHCHAEKVVHRDIKPSNLLINNRGELKIADYGLARVYSPDLLYGKMTRSVVTLWYRAPELLLGDEEYTEAIDVWSTGCILAELLLQQKLFPCKDETDQITRIMDVLGGITRSNYEDCEKLPLYNKINPANFSNIKLFDVFKHTSMEATHLVELMLTLDPKRRITIQQALNHKYFHKEPLACVPLELPRIMASHEYTVKKRYADKSKKLPSKSLASLDYTT